MTRPTRRRLLFSLPAGLAVALVTAWLFWPRTAITEENAAKVQVGMTLAEVEAVLGGPARDESTGPLTTDIALRQVALRQVMLDDSLSGLWTSNHVMVCINFGADRQVTQMSWFPVRRAQESLLDHLRRWLGL
jgi:hypothetical protein